MFKSLQGAFPAVTTTAQSAMLTGKTASEHGIVGNGWYFKELAEVGFWRQANQLVQQPKIWDELKEQNPDFKTANSFWWYNMYSSVDYSMTPRPHYPADGSKVFDLYSHPNQFHYDVEKNIGKFPFFNFWGPKANIKSSQWIANASLEVQRKYAPNLHLIYLPHLDYNLQKLGPNDPAINKDLADIDQVIKNLVGELHCLGTDSILVSEYGIEAVNKPIHINRFLRKQGFLQVRKTNNLETLDPGASQAFAVADHQIAHIYVRDGQAINEIKEKLQHLPGIRTIIDADTKAAYGINHERSGDLVIIAEDGAWFTYYYWLDDKNAPDFARTIDIHRKPGYDPVEMFLDPDNKLVNLKLIARVLQKKLGFRALLDVIPIKPELIRGSHGRLPENKDYWPVIIGDESLLTGCERLTDVYQVIKRYFT